MGNKNSHVETIDRRGKRLIFSEITENVYKTRHKQYQNNKDLIIETMKKKYERESANHFLKMEFDEGFGRESEHSDPPKALNYNLRYISKSDHSNNHIYYETPLSNSFIGTILESYNKHIPLELKPDHIWFNIMGNLAHYIDKNSEKFRPYFVNFDGKKELTINTMYDVMSLSPSNDDVWDKLFDQIHNLIKSNVKNDLAEWSIPDFSTSTKKDKLIGKFILMAACKNFFSYGFSTCCGIPKITILGTQDDWILLKKKLDKLDIFNDSVLSDWKTKLCTVLDHFIDSFNNNVDKEFWGRIMSVKSTFGSGATTYYSGWSTVFNPFEEYGTYLLNEKNGIYQTISVDNIMSSYVDFDVTLTNDVSNEKCKVKGVVGCFGELYDKTNNILTPAFEFALLD